MRGVTGSLNPLRYGLVLPGYIIIGCDDLGKKTDRKNSSYKFVEVICLLVFLSCPEGFGREGGRFYDEMLFFLFRLLLSLKSAFATFYFKRRQRQVLATT